MLVALQKEINDKQPMLIVDASNLKVSYNAFLLTFSFSNNKDTVIKCFDCLLNITKD